MVHQTIWGDKLAEPLGKTRRTIEHVVWYYLSRKKKKKWD